MNTKDLQQRLCDYARDYTGTTDTEAMILEAADALEKLERIAEVKWHETELARARYDKAVSLLTGIHSLMYPAPFTTVEDGKTWVFRPKDPDPHVVLQELSDRIRALPEKLAAIQAPQAGHATFALQALVAAGHVTQQKVDEALSIARNVAPAA